MDFFEVSLILSALLCSLVAGLLFAYAVVVMPGFKTLDDKSFLQAFQVTDRIIQDNQPLFILVWLGSALAIIAALVFGISHLTGPDFWILVVAVAIYIVGVQVTTVVVHLPLNNQLQTLSLDTMSAEELNEARRAFEPKWNRSNVRRTILSCLVSLLLMILLMRL